VSRGLVLTYHAIEDGPAPLFVSPALFREHVRLIADSGARVLSLDEVADGLESGTLPGRWVAITFDDAYASVAHHAAPVLAERDLPAAVFALAGRLGADNQWPGQPASVPARPLATAAELGELARAGWAVGSHGVSHARLDGPDAPAEVTVSRKRLEAELGCPVRWFALPYGAEPAPEAAGAIASAYRGCCALGNRPAAPGDSPLALPRVDAHYLRRPAMLRRALAGRYGHLTLRRLGAALRPGR
jgi:peptidoglycan/xylan/chitin deacetylase (PgdA/CDA1 family)